MVIGCAEIIKLFFKPNDIRFHGYDKNTNNMEPNVIMGTTKVH